MRQSTLARAEALEERRRWAPVLGTDQEVPWSVHLGVARATQAEGPRAHTAEEVAALGGFTPGELSEYAPGWAKRARQRA